MKGKIVKVLIDIGSENFIIVVEEQNEFRLEFYRVMRAEVVLCYIIPMYNFKQLLTDTFQYQNQYLMVGAEYQNKSYLLIYNLRNSAFSALIYVTEIDESLQFFQFYDSAKKTVVYLYEGKLYFYLLDQFCLKYSLQQPNALIRRKKISILVNSLINNQSATINFQISKLNTDYILSTFNNTQQLSFLNKPLNQDLFRGNIIRVEVQKKEDFVVMLPLNITSEHLYCHYFESNVCFFNNSFIDIQTLKIIYTLSFQQTSFNIRRIIFDEKTQVYQIILSYSKNQNIEILQIEQAEDNLNQSVLISKKNGYSILPKSYVDQVQNIKIIQNLYFFQFIGSNSLIYYKDICQIIINSSQSSNFKNYFTDLAYLSNNTYIYILLDNQKFRIKIIATNDNKIEKAQYCNIDIIQEHEINLLNILNQIDLYYFHIEMKNVEIISVTKKEFIYVLQFLMIQHTNFGLLLEISLNAIKYDDLKIESYRFLRYEKDAQILQMLYADMQFIVAKFQQDGKFFVNVYDIKGDMKNKDYLDSIYRIQSLEYQRIERFNTSHYIIYSKMNKKLYFMTLNQLTVECLGQCTENANLILSNDVSTLTLEISLEIQPGQNYSTIKSVIILTNLLFILIFLKFGRRSRISLQFQ